jgi:hypothetical protein
MFTDDAALQVEIGDKTWQMPSSGHVRVIFDGPIIELFSTAGIFSAPIPIAGARKISVTGSACSIYEL